MKKNIVFLAHTNYHVLFSISIIMENFRDADKYNVALFYTHQLEQPLDLREINCDCRSLSKKEKGGRLSPETVNEIDAVIASRPARFFHFNEDEFIGIYLASRLRKNGTVTGLGQDGLKAYAIIDKPALKYRLMRTIEYYRFLKANKLQWHPYFFNIKYGRSSSTDELWLSHPGHSLLKSKPAHKVDFFVSPEEAAFSKKAFGFSSSGMQTDKVIFFVSSIVKDIPAILEVEKEIIAKLRKRFPDMHIYLKVHPRTPKNILDDIHKIEGISLISDTAPAEFFISQLTDSIVLGSYSAGLLYNNPKARFYWLYPLYAKYIATFKYTILVNPTDHIRIVDDVEKIEI